MTNPADKDPIYGDAASSDAIELVVVPRTADIGGFAVRRALPTAKRRMVGPFVFMDQMGPDEIPFGEGLDVRPHPHIGLATVTYLFDGEIIHRDSTGVEATIRPGDVNWMTAGRGIAHSERSSAAFRTRSNHRTVAGLQTWVALPRTHEEVAPSFHHHDGAALPEIAGDGATVRLILGSAYGETSPVSTFTDTIYADVVLAAGGRFPVDADHEERALYIFEGEVEIAGDVFEAGRLLVLRPGDPHTVTARKPTRLMLVGGAPMDGPRHIWWNFVASSKERIEEAKADWKAGRFGKVFGDENEFMPLPD
ncbi:pirin family protein [Kaistia dalseonensis]|uniref:Redox-sensitive bicupin YhaK (Pirin superfamily) n=1 Tax=Kaistia dalseonensis TaxID=410840 RepID=A0ABU0HCL8_9HYPH|nr:pirin family protein [Kaistia dalseonensis]MCX5497425.1 pirin family protein [Kaistia dalseonensis]MDQ0440064.1 redox-sensitive bicupin YhaK (pirin superfamily) [Kaistia dalseonensis]